MLSRAKNAAWNFPSEFHAIILGPDRAVCRLTLCGLWGQKLRPCSDAAAAMNVIINFIYFIMNIIKQTPQNNNISIIVSFSICVLLPVISWYYRPIDWVLLCCRSDDVELSTKTFAWSCSHHLSLHDHSTLFLFRVIAYTAHSWLFSVLMHYINWHFTYLLIYLFQTAVHRTPYSAEYYFSCIGLLILKPGHSG